MHDFFRAVLPNEDGWVPIIVKDEMGSLRSTSWFQWPAEADEMVKHVQSLQSTDVYFSPMLYTEPKTRRTAGHVAKANVTHAACVYADGDTAQPNVYILAPTVNVESSEGRWHNYWRLTDTTDPKIVEELAHSVSREHKDDGVDNGWALSKRLRVPHTTNTKYEPTWKVKADLSGPTYTLAEFAADYPPVETAEVEVGDIPDDLPSAWDVLNSVENDPELLNLFTTPPIRDYSRALFQLEMRLFEQGLSAEQVFAVCREAACNKFNRPGRTEQELWQHVQVAKKKHLTDELAEQQQQNEDEEEDTAPASTEPRTAETTWDDLDLLTAEERASLPRTYIDRFADWGNSMSKLSARQYHESAAFMLLATVLSEFGYVRPSFGKVHLNLYMLVLGETTRSRKSTSLRFMLRIIDELSGEGSGYNYLPGQDATPEALTEYLAERPGGSSLFYRDEVQGMFQHVKSGGYLANLFSMLTATYDGYVNGVLRRTGATKRTKRTETNLNFYGVGIADQTIEALTVEDFKSGFVPRFVWVIDQNAEYTIGSADVKQYDPKDHSEHDKVFDRLVVDLMSARAFWEKYKITADEPSLIRFRDDAWTRWQAFTVDIEEAARAHTTHAELLDAPAQRLGVTVLKMAALLAMIEKKQTVEMEHMLSAIHYANKFIKYTEYAARQVTQTAQARDLQELEELVIGSAKPVTYAAALKKFRDRKTLREFDDMVKWLQEEGTIRLTPKGRQKVLEAIV